MELESVLYKTEKPTSGNQSIVKYVKYKINSSISSERRNNRKIHSKAYDTLAPYLDYFYHEPNFKRNEPHEVFWKNPRTNELSRSQVVNNYIPKNKLHSTIVLDEHTYFRGNKEEIWLLQIDNDFVRLLTIFEEICGLENLTMHDDVRNDLVALGELLRREWLQHVLKDKQMELPRNKN